MVLFVLVHGGQHGSWCWTRLEHALRARGAVAVAPDLPVDDTTAGAVRYADEIVQSIPDSAADVIVVGHSMAGLAIPLVPLLRPVRRLVFLSALIPVPNMSFNDVLALHPRASRYPAERNETDSQGRQIVPWPVAREIFYSDCAEDVAMTAWQQLRPQATLLFEETCPLTAWPDVEASFVIGKADPVIDLEWMRSSIHDRFGQVAVELDGGHSLFLSKPEQLADALVTFANGG